MKAAMAAVMRYAIPALYQRMAIPREKSLTRPEKRPPAADAEI